MRRGFKNIVAWNAISNTDTRNPSPKSRFTKIQDGQHPSPPTVTSWSCTNSPGPSPSSRPWTWLRGGRCAPSSRLGRRAAPWACPLGIPRFPPEVMKQETTRRLACRADECWQSRRGVICHLPPPGSRADSFQQPGLLMKQATYTATRANKTTTPRSMIWLYLKDSVDALEDILGSKRGRLCVQ